MSVKDLYSVQLIQSEESYPWLLRKHYAHRIPSISFCYGLYFNKILSGVLTVGKPPSNALCVGVCGGLHSKHVYELNRLCINENMQKNTLSFFLANTLKLLPSMILISYADTSKGHHGYIYQATNWVYTGLSAKRTERYDKNNPNKHSKTVTQNKGVNYQDLDVRDRPQKHRYVYFIGTKAQRKEWDSQLKYKRQTYPKGDNGRYDARFEPQTQLRLF